MSVEAEILLSNQNLESKRWVILEESNDVAYLYLTEPNIQKPVGDSIVYTKRILKNNKAAQEMAKNGLPPIVTESFASESAVINNVKESDISFKWSLSGHAVSVYIKNEPSAFIEANGSQSYSKAVIKAGPFGNPWDQKAFEALFE